MFEETTDTSIFRLVYLLCMAEGCCHEGIYVCSEGDVDGVLAGAGSWDESLRLWFRIGHPNSTPKSSSGLADTPQGDKQEVRRPLAGLLILFQSCLYVKFMYYTLG